MKVVIIAFAAVWPTLLNTLDGMNGVDRVKLDSAGVLGLSRPATVHSVVLPAASPQIAAGLRNSLQAAIILMVVSEIVEVTLPRPRDQTASKGDERFARHREHILGLVMSR